MRQNPEIRTIGHELCAHQTLVKFSVSALGVGGQSGFGGDLRGWSQKRQFVPRDGDRRAARGLDRAQLGGQDTAVGTVIIGKRRDGHPVRKNPFEKQRGAGVLAQITGADRQLCVADAVAAKACEYVQRTAGLSARDPAKTGHALQRLEVKRRCPPGPERRQAAAKRRRAEAQNQRAARRQCAGLMNVPLRKSDIALTSSSRVFMTIGPCQAIGSWIGAPEISRNRTPASPD